MKNKLFLSVITLVFSAAMISCSSDDSGEEGPKPIEKSKVSGIIEKGPFVQGSKVTLYELENNLSQTGKSFKTQTNSDLGAFSFDSPIQLNSQFVELETSGYFYNEVKGELSTSQITLNALSNVASRNAVNVNLITHLEYGRVKKLVRDGQSFSDAKKQAERELLSCFAITDEINVPEGVSVTDNNRNSAILLAISTIMLHERSEAEFTEFISKFSTDFADNGQIDQATIREDIKKGQEDAHPSKVIERMKEFYSNKGVDIQIDDFSRYIDFNGDGVINEEDEETLDVTPGNQTTEETFFTTEQNVKDAVSGCYMYASVFTSNQMVLQAVRFKAINGEDNGIYLNRPSDNFIYNTWTSAYNAISRLNVVIDGLEATNAEYDITPYLNDARTLRAFVYYQMGVLWGNVPLVLHQSDATEGHVRQATQQEVFSFCHNELLKSLPQTAFPQRAQNEEFMFSKSTALSLIAEIELWFDVWNYQDARIGAFDGLLYFLINKENDAFQQYLSLIGDNNIKVYDDNVNKLLADEKSGKGADALAGEWKDKSTEYIGTWAAVKRLGKAVSLTGCKDHELLLPIPDREMMYTPSLVQNPGY